MVQLVKDLMPYMVKIEIIIMLMLIPSFMLRIYKKSDNKYLIILLTAVMGASIGFSIPLLIY